MSVSSWLPWTFSCGHALRGQRRNPATTSSRRQQTFRPRPEALETRLTLSLTTLAAFAPDGAFPSDAVIMDSSGNLYGTASGGGASNDGTIFELAHGSPKITTLASFNGTNGADPLAALIMDSSGNLYGTTSGGGASNDGTVFELAHGSGTITALASFNGTNGAGPRAGLIMDSSGNLYGNTVSGGASNVGTVFELSHGSGTITTLASFDGTDGRTPSGGLIMDSSGNLYGTTASGGAPNHGTVFELAHGSGTITTLASFNGTNGADPEAGLIMDSSGNLYGTAVSGGASNYGTVFELAHGSGTITALASFSRLLGAHPHAALIMDSSGNLYGTAFGGGAFDGTVFELAHGSGAISTLAAFLGRMEDPSGTLIMDSFGNLYGTTFQGGASNDGTVFKLVHGSHTITTLASFDGTKLSPIGVIMDSSGNLYGTTGAGGASNDGTVFELAHGSGTITTLASFNGTNGAGPQAALIIDSSGNLYGTTSGGGASNDGTVFELAPDSGTITTLASFNGTNGANPFVAALIMDSSGNLYGTAPFGGASNDGTVFELAHGSGTITALASFNGPNGANPYAALIMDSTGNLYGTTISGGAWWNGNTNFGYGTVFELVHRSGRITTLASFGGLNGAYPWAAPIMDSSGNLYGTTAAGGDSNVGTVFELAHGSGTITTLASFYPIDGQFPEAGLIMDSGGNLYGTALSGGASSDGTVFELAQGSGTITTLASFNGTNGTNPRAGLIMDRSGNLYGTTEAGGLGLGTVFELPGAVAQPHFQISGFPSSTSTGASQTITVTVHNAHGTTDTGYTGTVHFTSSDAKAVLPAHYTFNASDKGKHTFIGLVLKKKRKQSITATDTLSSSITGSLSVNVS